MKVTLNGEEREVAEGVTVLDLVREAGIDGRLCAVEVNLEVVPRARHGETRLRDGDRMEIVTMVGGG